VQKKYITPFEAVVFFASLLLFGAILHFHISTDIQRHAETIQKVANGSLLPPANFMYYLTVYTIALFNTETSFLYSSSILVLSLSVTIKFTITRTSAVQYYRHILRDDAISDTPIILASVLLLVVFSLPTNTIYLGQIPPNVWHNSTTIFVMPFALSLFWLSYNQLVQPTTTGAVLITILCVLNALIKPSFFFVFSVSYPLMLLRRFGLGRYRWRNLLPVVVGSIAVVVMYYLTYRLSFGNLDISESGIAIRPLSVWSHFSSNIALSLVFSLVFPIVYLGFYWKDLMKHALLQYAVVAYLISISIFALFSETGPREFHGNFFWQSVICSYILFLVTTVLFAEKVKTLGVRDWRNITILVAFTSHVIAGVLYLVKVFYTKNAGIP
jgi:hypothetical protein